MISPALQKSPKHARLIGLMVVGYGDLELTFAHCAGLVLNLQYEVLHAVQKVRSEGARIEIANALSGGAYAKLGLNAEYSEVIGALRHRLSIRNQYAHCQYEKVARQLSFLDPENAFSDPAKPFAWKPISLPLLKEQAAFFEWTRGMLIWLELSIPRLLAGERNPHSRPKPRRTPLPKKHSPLRPQARSRSGSASGR